MKYTVPINTERPDVLSGLVSRKSLKSLTKRILILCHSETASGSDVHIADKAIVYKTK